jgi:Holliday junction resolvase RusA-like endonuclease
MNTPQTLRFTIPGALPGLNEIVAANRKSRYTGAEQKRDTQAFIAPFVPRPIATLRSPVVVTIAWHEKDARRDPDNVNAGVKFVLDTLTALGVLVGDGRKHIAGITHRVTTDRANPRVEVTIEGAS